MTKLEIAKLADKIRDAFNLTTQIDLKDLIERRLNGRITHLAADQTDYKEAYILPLHEHERGETLFEIGILESFAEKDQRTTFSIAHELGHLFLHLGFLNKAEWAEKVKENKKLFRYGGSKTEYEAHEFAACLLMPKDEYKHQVIHNTTNDETDIQAIADYFGVSYSAALNRGKWLGIFSWDD